MLKPINYLYIFVLVFSHTVCSCNYGTYNDGFENVYAFSNDVSLIIGIVEPK